MFYSEAPWSKSWFLWLTLSWPYFLKQRFKEEYSQHFIFFVTYESAQWTLVHYMCTLRAIGKDC
jgi:hypothetical protein